MNPYSGTTFFQFIATFCRRIFEMPFSSDFSFAQDEVQIYTLSLIAISASLTGVFLVLRRMCMLANSLSHTILTGVVFAFFIHSFFIGNGDGFEFSALLPSEGLLFVASLGMAFLTAFLTDRLVTLMQVKDDAATGIVFSFLFAIGIILVTAISRNAHIGAELIMGNADALTPLDLTLSLRIALVNCAITFLFFRPLFYTTFDPVFSRVVGLHAGRYGYLLMAQLAVTAIAAFQAVGVLMVVAFLVVPPIIARRLTSRLWVLVFIACCTGVIASFISVALSRHLFSVYGAAASTSALTVVLLVLFYAASLFKKKGCN